jgi:hypothetical protein
MAAKAAKAKFSSREGRITIDDCASNRPQLMVADPLAELNLGGQAEIFSHAGHRSAVRSSADESNVRGVLAQLMERPQQDVRPFGSFEPAEEQRRPRVSTQTGTPLALEKLRRHAVMDRMDALSGQLVGAPDQIAAVAARRGADVGRAEGDPERRVFPVPSDQAEGSRRRAR